MKVTSGKVVDEVDLGSTTLYSEPVNVTGCARITFTATSTGAAKADLQISHEGYDENAPWVTVQAGVDLSDTAPLKVTIEHQCNHARLAFHDGSGETINAWIHGEKQHG